MDSNDFNGAIIVNKNSVGVMYDISYKPNNFQESLLIKKAKIVGVLTSRLNIGYHSAIKISDSVLSNYDESVSLECLIEVLVMYVKMYLDYSKDNRKQSHYTIREEIKNNII